MNKQDEVDKTTEQMKENGDQELGAHEDVYEQEGKKALVFDEKGYAREVGEGTWRKYHGCDNR